MPTFICENCGAVENTATSDYWMQKMEGNPVTCSLCSRGIWHGYFERKHWSSYGLEAVLNAQKLNKGYLINAREHLRNIGIIGSKKSIKKEIEWQD